MRDGGSFQDNLKQNIDSTLSQPGKAADAAENLKDEFYSRKEKAEDAENTKEEHDA